MFICMTHRSPVVALVDEFELAVEIADGSVRRANLQVHPDVQPYGAFFVITLVYMLRVNIKVKPTN